MKRPSSDSLNPVLVKELRQGIRSKMFLGSFMTIQIMLFLYGTVLLMNESFRQDSDEVALFWMWLSLPLLFLVPAMAGQAIENEVKGGTLELLLVTRLSSIRLVLGKWASVVVQGVLLVTSALPYLMLRYFLGGVDVWGELTAIGLLVAASALLAAITMGFWATKTSKLVKLGAVLALFTIVPYGAAVLLAYRGGMFGTGMASVLWAYGALVLPIMLTLAASRIGPPAENHTTTLRVLALLCLVVGLCFRSPGNALALSTVLAIAIVVPFMVGGLTEPIRPLPRLYAPFVKREGLSRWLSMPFAPGWPGGLAFALLVFALVPFFQVWIDEFRPIVFLAAVATFLAPAAVVHTLLPQKRRNAVFYLTLLVASTVPLYVYAGAHAFGNEMLVAGIEAVLGFSPPAVLAFELWEVPGYHSAVATIELLLVTGVSSIVLFRQARREWSKVAERSRSKQTQPTLAPVVSVVEGSAS